MDTDKFVLHLQHEFVHWSLDIFVHRSVSFILYMELHIMTRILMTQTR
jgi:hypothetical protein